MLAFIHFAIINLPSLSFVHPLAHSLIPKPTYSFPKSFILLFINLSTYTFSHSFMHHSFKPSHVLDPAFIIPMHLLTHSLANSKRPELQTLQSHQPPPTCTSGLQCIRKTQGKLTPG